MGWLRLGAVVLGLTAVSLFLLIVWGTFDPKPIGELTGTAGPHTLTIPPQDQKIVWLPEMPPSGNFTVRATIKHQSGELDSGSGLALGDGCTAVIITLSPLGYVSIRQNSLITNNPLPYMKWSHSDITEMPWQPWPHVHTGSDPNEIWLDVEDGQLRVRINRELLWTGDLPFQPTQAGLYGESFGDTAVFDYQQIMLFADAREP